MNCLKHCFTEISYSDSHTVEVRCPVHGAQYFFRSPIDGKFETSRQRMKRMEAYWNCPRCGKKILKYVNNPEEIKGKLGRCESCEKEIEDNITQRQCARNKALFTEQKKLNPDLTWKEFYQMRKDLGKNENSKSKM